MKNALKQPPVIAPRAVHAAVEPDDFSVYEEYVRGFDDVPVLQDAVDVPPRPRPPPDFRRGERRDVRKEARPDAYDARVDNAAELARFYDEYCGKLPGLTPTKKRAKTTKRKPGARKGRVRTSSRTKAGPASS